MATKIKQVTILGRSSYQVGKEYNGLLLDHIKDESSEFPDMLHLIYSGYTASNELVFRLINAPLDVEYESA